MWLTTAPEPPPSPRGHHRPRRDRFAGNLQQDAHEFLSDLINVLHDETQPRLDAAAAYVGKPETEPVVAGEAGAAEKTAAAAAAAAEAVAGGGGRRDRDKGRNAWCPVRLEREAPAAMAAGAALAAATAVTGR